MRGEDWWWQPPPDSRDGPSGAHLFVCQHGLWGSPDDVAFLEQYLQHNGWLTLNARSNSARCTFDGADVCGDRLAAEVVGHVKRLAAAGVRVTHISFAAYSFGGLIARYAVGKLLASGFFGVVVPVNFLTIATPHLGCWEHPSSMSHLAYNSILPWTLSRTGRQLLLADRWLEPEGLPLLAAMARPDCAFHAALAAFNKRVLLADIRSDRTVPYTTAAITAVNPYLPAAMPYALPPGACGCDCAPPYMEGDADIGGDDVMDGGDGGGVGSGGGGWSNALGLRSIFAFGLRLSSVLVGAGVFGLGWGRRPADELAGDGMGVRDACCCCAAAGGTQPAAMLALPISSSYPCIVSPHPAAQQPASVGPTLAIPGGAAAARGSLRPPCPTSSRPSRCAPSARTKPAVPVPAAAPLRSVLRQDHVAGMQRSCSSPLPKSWRAADAAGPSATPAAAACMIGPHARTAGSSKCGGSGGGSQAYSSPGSRSMQHQHQCRELAHRLHQRNNRWNDQQLGSSRPGSAPVAARSGADDALSSRVRLGLFVALLPVLLSLWLCMVAWLAAIWMHHYAVLLTVRPDRSWEVRIRRASAAGVRDGAAKERSTTVEHGSSSDGGDARRAGACEGRTCMLAEAAGAAEAVGAEVEHFRVVEDGDAGVGFGGDCEAGELLMSLTDAAPPRTVAAATALRPCRPVDAQPVQAQGGGRQLPQAGPAADVEFPAPGGNAGDDATAQWPAAAASDEAAAAGFTRAVAAAGAATSRTGGGDLATVASIIHARPPPVAANTAAAAAAGTQAVPMGLPSSTVSLDGTAPSVALEEDAHAQASAMAAVASKVPGLGVAAAKATAGEAAAAAMAEVTAVDAAVRRVVQEIFRRVLWRHGEQTAHTAAVAKGPELVPNRLMRAMMRTAVMRRQGYAASDRQTESVSSRRSSYSGAAALAELGSSRRSSYSGLAALDQGTTSKAAREEDVAGVVVRSAFQSAVQQCEEAPHEPGAGAAAVESAEVGAAAVREVIRSVVQSVVRRCNADTTEPVQAAAAVEAAEDEAAVVRPVVRSAVDSVLRLRHAPGDGGGDEAAAASHPAAGTAETMAAVSQPGHQTPSAVGAGLADGGAALSGPSMPAGLGITRPQGTAEDSLAQGGMPAIRDGTGVLPRGRPEGPAAPQGEATEVAQSHDPALLLSEMIAFLNELEWQKVDVDTRHYHAHAAIVVRSSRRFRSHMHIIDYAVRQLRL